MLISVEHEKSFITSEPDGQIMLKLLTPMSCHDCNLVWHEKCCYFIYCTFVINVHGNVIRNH